MRLKWYNQPDKYRTAGAIRMKKTLFIILTVLIMLITSRFFVRIVDATVQIDDDIGLIVILLFALNAVIGVFSHKLYKKTIKK